MKLTDAQSAEFESQGFLLFPGLIERDELDVLRGETERLSSIDSDHVFRAGDIATVYRCHEVDGPTASHPFAMVARLPRTLGVARQLLGDELYVYNSKLNLKKAVTGWPMLWHQDYGYWKLDRMPEPRAATMMIALGDVDEIGGGLYVIPESHRNGLLRHRPQVMGAHKQVAIDRDVAIDTMKGLPEPIPLTGPAGTCAIFHCNVIHGSGQNLSAHDRWQAYFAYNPVDNAPPSLAHERPEFMKSNNTAPLSEVDDDSVVRPDTVYA